MSKRGLAEIVCVVDRSGSMGVIRDDAIGGFNVFLQQQKGVPGEARITLVLFDHEYLVPWDGRNIQDVEELNNTSYVPRGTTALLDAIGRAITTVGERLANTLEEKRPEKVIVAILTDGQENSSCEYDLDRIKGMIDHQRETYSWEFVFLAANQDAIQSGAQMGILMKDAFNFAATGQGVRDAYLQTSKSVTRYRVGK